MAFDDRRTVVKTLSVRGSGLDPVAARLRAEALLGAVELRPRNLPPSAILCIRRLVDPRPGALLLDQFSVRPPRAWEEALSASLDAMVRLAARPALGVVGAAADAVIFSDRSELLACLAEDFLRGQVAARWWWTNLLPDAAAARAAVAAWIEAPEHVPGALHLLAERGEAVPFVKALAKEEARALGRVLGDRFGAQPLWAAIEASAEGAPQTRDDLAQEERATGEQMRGDHRQVVVDAPWVRWAPESRSVEIGTEQRAVLGIGLMLHRAPMTARSLGFAELVGRWGKVVSSGKESLEMAGERWTRDAETPPTSSKKESSQIEVSVAPPIGEPAIHEPTPARRLDQAPATEIRPSLFARAAATQEQSTEGQQRAVVAAEPTASPLVNTGDAMREDKPLNPPAASPAGSLPDWVLPEPPIRRDEPAHPASELARAGWSSEERPERLPRTWPAPIQTNLGGLFFLINLGLYLELYGDFSTPLTSGIDLPVWDFITLVGRDLLGKHTMDSDPVWRLLADLAGRGENEPPGSHFEPPDEWRIPAAWLRPFRDGGAWIWTAENGRLEVRHPAGFVVVDVGAEEAAEEQARREACEYGEQIEIAREPGDPRLNEGVQPLDRWLGWLLPYVRARLMRALQPGEWKDIGSMVCAIPARIHETATHLDVVMSLAELPVEIRLAGLDRDPGWVPPAGKYVAFHFS